MERELSNPQVQRLQSGSRAKRSFSSSRRSSASELLSRLTGSPSKSTVFVNEEVPPALEEALELLNLRDLSGLEDNFLNTEAFLRPWSFFRDTFLLVQPKGMPRASAPGQISRMDIIWWYTFYDEGKMRFDRRSDPSTRFFDRDTSKWGVIDRTLWGVEEYEKYLYTWLLQAFKVGKKVNRLGFDYFQQRSIITAWERVFLPVLDAVRKDYNHTSKFRYGRLAKFIEDVCPSHFSMPDSHTFQDALRSQTPAHAIGMTPRASIRVDPSDAGPVTGVLWNHKKVYDDEEKELKRSYPLYGHLGELPKLKTVVKDWLKQQKESLQRKRALRHLEGGDVTPTRTPRSSLHGVTMKYDYGEESPYEKMKLVPSEYSDYSRTASPKRASPTRRPTVPKRESSDGVYTAIRSSNPFTFTEHESQVLGTHSQPRSEHVRQTSHTSNRSVNVAAEPKQCLPNNLAMRYLSYEGNSYGSLPPLKEMDSKECVNVRDTRIPSPVNINPVGNSRGYHPIVEKAVARAETTPIPTGPKPAVPPRSLKRQGSMTSHVSSGSGVMSDISAPSTPWMAKERTLGNRIVSKENIRGALGGLSRETSEDPLKSQKAEDSPTSFTDAHAFASIGGRGLNTGESMGSALPTFNTHMFPREARQTPVRVPRKMVGEGHEMAILKGKGMAR